MKDQTARTAIEALEARVRGFEELIVADCPTCGHRTMQEKFFLKYNMEHDAYYEISPTVFHEFLSGHRLSAGARCLTCGSVFKLAEVKRELVELVRPLDKVQKKGGE